MVPGNRPEDFRQEHFWEVLIDHAPDDHLPEEWWDDTDGIVKLVQITHDLAYAEGLNDGKAEADMAISSLESDIEEELQPWFYENQDCSARTYLAKRAEIRHKLRKS
jgi:hypothetical protein